MGLPRGCVRMWAGIPPYYIAGISIYLATHYVGGIYYIKDGNIKDGYGSAGTRRSVDIPRLRGINLWCWGA